MNISKISSNNKFNCSFNARGRNNESNRFNTEDFEERSKVDLCDYFGMGCKRLETLEDCDEQSNCCKPVNFNKVLFIDVYHPVFKLYGGYAKDLEDSLRYEADGTKYCLVKDLDYDA